jgi:diaminopimelate decarboxylase
MSQTKPGHAPMLFDVAGDELQIGGVPITRLAARVGTTPFYAYDRALISARVKELRAELPASVHLHFAMKANPMPAVVQHLATQVDGFDVASGGELRVALDAGMSASLISFAGPGKSDAELTQAIAAGITLNAESPDEIGRISRIGSVLGITPNVAIRVNPDFELKSSGMKMSGGPKQFGVDAETVPSLLKDMKALPVHFTGFHIFSGSQNLSADAIIEAQTKALDLAVQLAAQAPRPPALLNLGGGFGIPYFPGETQLDLARVAAFMRDTLSPGASRRLPGTRLVIELGRYLVGEAGVYICRVIERKISRGQVFLITDGGLHHHLAASGNFGQVVRKNYPVVIANRIQGTKRESASVVGPLCTPLDLLGDRMDLAHAEPGDLVAVLQSGAYGFTASPHRFLSHPMPVEVLV